MSQQAVRIGKTRTKSNGTRTTFKITFYGFDRSFVRIGCLIRQDQLQVVILRLFHSAQLRTFIFKIFFLVDLEIGKHFRNIRQGGQQAGRRDQATDLKRYTVHIPFERRRDGRIGIIRFRTKQTRFGLLYPQTGDIGFRQCLFQADRRNDVLFHQALYTVRFDFRHFQLGLHLLIIGLRLFDLFIQFGRGKLEQDLSLLHVLSFVNQDIFNEPFHFRFNLHKLDSLHIGYIRLSHFDTRSYQLHHQRIVFTSGFFFMAPVTRGKKAGY